MKRAIIEIDKEKCNGCGDCVVACAEGALQIIDGKAVVVNDSFCDGLGACIGHCPTDALKIVQKEVVEFNEKAVAAHLQISEDKNYDVPCNCPGMAMQDFTHDAAENLSSSPAPAFTESQLRQWPIQLHLVNPDAPYFQNCNLLIAATCSAFSCGGFHHDFLKNHTLVIACPKLDRTEGYFEKLVEIIRKGAALSVAVVRMEVPCCQGLTRLVKDAIQASGRNIPFLETVISIKGKIV